MTIANKIKTMYKLFFKKYLFQIIGIFLLLIITTIVGFSENILNQYLIDNIICKNNYTYFLRFILIYVGINYVCIFLSYALGKWNLSITQNCSINMRKQFMQHIHSCEFSNMTKNRISQYIVLITEDIAVISNFYNNVIVGNLVAILTIIVMLVYVFYYSSLIGIVVICTSFLEIVCSTMFSKSIKKNQEEIKLTSQEHIDKIDCNFRNLALIKSFLLYSKMIKEYVNTLSHIKKVAYKNFDIEYLLGFFLNTISLLRSILIISISCYGISKGTFTLGVLVIILNLSDNVSTLFTQLASTNIQIQAFIVSINRLFNILELKSESAQRELNIGDIKLKKINEIRLENICFSYENKQVLDNLNAKFIKDTINVIVGKSGKGKSTIINLLDGLYNYNGRIYFDDIDISTVDLNEIRKNISVCFQDDLFINGSIYDNLNIVNESMTKNKLLEILDLVQASSFIDKLPDGLDTNIGEISSNFSGGELQRISLARALVKDSQIYIFDESFANMDYAMRTKIFKDVTNYLKDKIIIVITHDDNLFKNYNINLIEI